MLVSINTVLNEQLINEGIIRDLIRKIQNFRKDSEFRVDDRINLSITADNAIYKAIDLNKNYLLSEVLAVNLTLDKCEGNFTTGFKLNDLNVKMSISKE